MIYTHSHVDHFGGVKGIITDEQVAAGEVEVIAPEGFMHHAIAENVFAGTAMLRRAGYMYGAALERGPAGQIGAGLGQTTSTGTVTLIAPDGRHHPHRPALTIDGVEIVFQVTPGTEAPAEMNFYFPQHRALCTAENTSHTLHNILTIRGARRCATPTPGRTTSPRPSTCGATSSTWCSRRTTGPPGAASGPSSSWPCSATCTSTCTTRRCG